MMASFRTVGVGGLLAARANRGEALFSEYKRWCDANGEHPGSQRALGMRLSERGHVRHKNGAGRFEWRGIGIRDG
jgi:hypothetical protein